MRAIITLMIVVTACLPALCAETPKPTSELDKPVTLAVKGESLADVVRMMEKQTSAKLRVSRSIQEQKVTVFVDKMPLRDVMSGICTALGFRFSRISDSKVYEIWEPEKNRQARVNTTIQAEAEAWKRIETNIDKGIAYSSLSPEARARARAGIPRGTQDPQLRVLADLYSAINNGFTSALVRLLGSDTRILEALRSGLAVHFDSRSTDPEWGLPQSVLDGLPDLAKRYPDGGLPEVLSACSKGDKDESMFIHMGISRDLEASGRSVSIEPVVEYCRGIGYPHCMFTQHLISADLEDRTPATLQTKLPQAGSPKFLDRKVSLTAEELVREAALPGTVKPGDGIYVNRSDVLALLHKHIGVQVISDHYSFWHRTDPVQDQSVAEILDRFSRESLSTGTGKPLQEAVRGWDDQFLYMRIEQIALADAAEVPNPLLRRWRDVLRKQGYLGLDEVAEIAWLNDSQIRGLRPAARFHGIDATPLYQLETSDGSLSHVADSAGPLRLYGILTTAQKQQAFAAGTRVDSFTREQYMVLADMLKKVVKSGSRFKAGLYSGEIRVDKRDTDDQMQPVMMQISGSLADGYQYQPPNGPAEPIVAETPGNAWREVRAKHPSANKKDLRVTLSSHSCAFTVYMADGSNYVWNVALGHRTTDYSDWEREQKQPSPRASGNAVQ